MGIDLELIKRSLDKPGKSKKGLAEAMGVFPSAITNLLKGARQLKLNEAPKVAAYLELEPRVPEHAAERDFYFPDRETMAVLAGKSIDRSHMTVSGSPVDKVARPWFLGEVKSAFGLIVSTASMAPVIEPHDMVIVNELLPPREKREVLICSPAEYGVFRAVVGRFMGETHTDWKIQEFAPDHRTSSTRLLAKKDWPDAFPVVAKILGS